MTHNLNSTNRVCLACCCLFAVKSRRSPASCFRVRPRTCSARLLIYAHYVFFHGALRVAVLLLTSCQTCALVAVGSTSQAAVQCTQSTCQPGRDSAALFLPARLHAHLQRRSIVTRWQRRCSWKMCQTANTLCLRRQSRKSAQKLRSSDLFLINHLVIWSHYQQYSITHRVTASGGM